MYHSIFVFLFLSLSVSGSITFRDDEDFEIRVTEPRPIHEERVEMELNVIKEIPEWIYSYYSEEILWSDGKNYHGSENILVHENIAIITRYESLIHILNISIIEEITTISTFEFEILEIDCKIERISLSYPLLYVGREYCGLSVLNISDYSLPRLVNNNNSRIISVVEDLCVLEDVLILIGFNKSLERIDEEHTITVFEPLAQFFDISEPNNFIFLFQHDHGRENDPIGVSCVSDVVSITWEYYGFEILKLSNENGSIVPEIIYESDHVENSEEEYVDVFYVGERYVYVSGYVVGPSESDTVQFFLFDMEGDDRHPISIYDTRIRCFGETRVAISGDLAFFGCHGSFDKWEEYIPYFDISERSEPKLAGYLGEYDETKILYLREIALQGNIAFVTTGSGLYVLRVGDLYVGNMVKKMCYLSCSECYKSDSVFRIVYDNMILYNDSYTSTTEKSFTIQLSHPNCYEDIWLQVLQILYLSFHVLLILCLMCTLVSVVCISLIILWNTSTSCFWWVSIFGLSFISQTTDPDGEYDLRRPMIRFLSFLFFLFIVFTAILFFSQLGLFILSPMICVMSVFYTIFLIFIIPFFLPVICQFCFVCPAFVCLCFCTKMMENVFRSIIPNFDDWIEIIDAEEYNDELIFRLGFRDHRRGRDNNNNEGKELEDMEDMEVVGMRSTSFKDAPEKSKMNAGEEDEEVSCSICLEPFKPSDECTILGCHVTHIFHTSCIRRSLNTSSNYCPLCRKFVDTVDNRPFDPSVDFCVIEVEEEEKDGEVWEGKEEEKIVENNVTMKGERKK